MSVVGAPSARLALAVGAVSEMVGTEAATVTLTAEEVATAPFESVMRAVSENEAAEVGVHATL